MANEKENPLYYEELIRNSPLFTIDPMRSPSRYERERLRLIETLHEYVRLKEWKREYRGDYENHSFDTYGLKYGTELFAVATACIRAYRPSEGVEFLHYFKAAWAKVLRRLHRRESLEQRQVGMLDAPVKVKRLAVKYLQYAAQREGRAQAGSSEEAMEAFSQDFGVPLEEVKRIVEFGILYAVDSRLRGEDGEEAENLMARIPAEDTPERSTEQKDAFLQAVERMNTVYRHVQERQKPILSELLTVRFGPDFLQTGEAGRAEFLSPELMECYRKTGTLPTQREIAQKYGRQEAGVSRTLSDFLKKVRG